MAGEGTQPGQVGERHFSAQSVVTLTWALTLFVFGILNFKTLHHVTARHVLNAENTGFNDAGDESYDGER